MPTSEARILANRLNAQRSTGPRTPEGKARSRANSLKHGMTGNGIVVPDEIRNEINERLATFSAELKPQTAVGEEMVEQMATMSVRMRRGAKQESAAIAMNVRHAVEAYDESRIEAAEQLFARLNENPRTSLRKLLKTPEGVEQLLDAWTGLRMDLTHEGQPIWSGKHLEKMVNLLGWRMEDAPGLKIVGLSRATRGYFGDLTDQQGAGLDAEARKAWARQQLVEQIDAEIVELEEHFDTFDWDAIDRDRAEAGDRALFDPSKEASLARRYESEARRAFFRAYQELQRVEAEAAREVEAKATPALAPSSVPVSAPKAARAVELLGSFREKPTAAASEPKPGPSWPFKPGDMARLDPEGFIESVRQSQQAKAASPAK